MKRWKWWAVIGALALLAAACSGDDAGDDENNLAPLPPVADDVVLRVLVDGAIAADWTLETLDYSLPFATLTIDGDDQRGPLLVDVLAASGVVTFESVEVLGLSEGRIAEVAITIDATEIDETWILDISNQGTLKLAAESLPRDQWVRDVAELRVN